MSNPFFNMPADVRRQMAAPPDSIYDTRTLAAHNHHSDDEDPPMVQGESIYDSRTMAAHNAHDSDDERAEAEPLYDARTMGGAPDEDYEDRPVPPPRPSTRSAGSSGPSSAINSSNVSPSSSMRGAAGLAGATKSASGSSSSLSTAAPSHTAPAPARAPAPALAPPAAAKNVPRYEEHVLPLPPPRSRAQTEVSHPVSAAMADMSLAAPPSKPTRRTPLPPPSSWWEAEAIKHNFAIAPWFHGVIDREVAEARLATQPLNAYLVRVSAEPGYVMSVRHPDRYMHVKIALEGGLCYVSKHSFNNVVEILDFYRGHDYAVGHRLSILCPAPAPVISLSSSSSASTLPSSSSSSPAHPEPRASALPPPTHISPVPPPRDRSATTTARPPSLSNPPALSPLPPPPPAAAADLMFGSEGAVYVDAEKEEAEREKRRQTNVVKKLPLPGDPRTWNEGEVIRFLTERGLQAFKEVFYNNAITGSRFLGLTGGMFRKGGFTEQQCEALQRAVNEAQRML